MPDISNFSDALDITHAEHPECFDVPGSKTTAKTLDPGGTPKNLFVGFGKPEITPISLRLKISETPKSTGGDRTNSNRPRRMRSQSECPPLNRSGPYDIPTAILIRKNQRSQARHNIRDNRADETPLSRRRSASESETISKPGSTFKINCIRARESGYYDCSSGLGEYYHLQYNYLDMADTSRIDKKKLFSTLEKLLTMPEDENQSQNIPPPVTVAWNEEDIAEMSKTNHIAQHIDQRKCLLYLLCRMIHHSARLTSIPPKFNGLSLRLLPENGRFPIERCNNCQEHPLPVLHIGSDIGVSVLPKKHDHSRPNIHDIHLENLTLLTVFPEAFSNMNISIPAERSKNGYHVLITPCLVEESTFELDERSDVTPKYPLESQKKTETADEPAGNSNTDVIVETADKTEAVGQPAESAETPTESQTDIDSPGTDRHITENPEVIEQQHVSTNTAIDNKGETNNLTSPCKARVTTVETPETQTYACETVVPEQTVFPVNGPPSPRKESDCDTNELKTGEIVLSVETHTSDETVEKPSPEIKSSLIKAIQPVKQVLNKKVVTNNNFISMELSIGVVNTYNKDVIHNWLTHCGITASKKCKVHKLRTKLLKYIQKIQKGKERPKISFVTSFLEKITYSELLTEAKRLEIPIEKHDGETENRRKVNEFFTAEAPSAGTPPQLLTTDEELSQSEVDTEDSGDDESWTQNPVKKVQRNTQSKTVKNKQDKSKDVKDTTSAKAKTAEEFKKYRTEDETETAEKKAEKKPKEPSPNPPMTEIWVKTLETTLLDLQNKVSNQGMLIDALNKKTLPDIHIPSDEHAKKIKSTESKMKILFDTLNIQQNSIDNLSDDMAAGVKEKKRVQDKMSQIQNSIKQQNGSNEETFKQLNSQIDSLLQSNTQYEQLLNTVKEEVHQVTASISNIVNGMRTIMTEIEALKSERSKPDTIGDPSRQLYQESMLTEMKNMRLESRTQLLDIKDMLAEYKSITSYVVAAIHDRKETKPTPPKPVIMPENFMHTSSIGKGEQNKGPQPKQTKVILSTEEQKPAEGQAAPNKPPHTSGRGKKDNKIGDKPPQNQQPDKPEPPVVRRRVENGGASKKEADTSQKEHESKTPDSSPTRNEKPRNTYRRKLSQGDSGKLRNTILVGQESKEERGNVSIDNTFFTRKEAQRQRYETRKCVVIHDPYFDKFDKNKFTKWFDITTFRYETLEAAKTEKSLQSKINKVHPEVIFLHVGQADLLNKTEGNKVVADLKYMIDTLSVTTTAKICTSLIIPLEVVPQVKSVITQVNREIANYITDLREKEGGKEKFFTQSNDELRVLIRKSTGSHGIVVSLTDRGQKKLWLHLKDALNRCMKITTRQNSAEVSRNNSQRSRLNNE